MPSSPTPNTLPRRGGGWHSIAYTLQTGWRVGFLRLFRAMRSRNACKTCALGMGGQRGGMVNEAGRWPEVCKKSLQAMAADMQGAIPDRHFFARLSHLALRSLTPRELEHAGRIPRPLLLSAGSSHYRPISWDEALTRIADKIKASNPERSFFYFSGRSSNEAGFLLQLFARLWGTNNVNNCSYYCHQASGVALNRSLGTGTATLSLEDLEGSDLVFLIGANPASNHPRLMTSLAHLRARGGMVIVINPVREQGLVNFSIPSQLRSLLCGSAIASTYVQPMIGGDLALLHGIAKAVMEAHPDTIARDFIADHCEDYESYCALLATLQWQDIIVRSGVTRKVIDDLAAQYARAKNAVFAWTMGLTHHVHGVANLQSLINLALLRGMVGRPHAGLLPIRGHSNVQGMGSMAVTPTLKEQVFRRLQEKGFSLPTRPGLDTMASMEAASRGEIDFALCLGGNLYGSNPDMAFARHAFSRIGLVVYLSTTLNTGHAHGTGEETIILPVAARDEEQQATTQESMFNYVRLSDGGPRRLATVRSEVDIIASLGHAVLGSEGALDWQAMADHRSIRQLIAQVIPGYEAVADLDRHKQEFFIPGRILHEPQFATASGRAKFAAHELPPAWELATNQLVMMSVRSEGQFNTVVYEEEDRYRGQERRDVILLNPADMRRLGIVRNQPLTVASATGTLPQLLARPFAIHQGCALMYYPEANVLISTALDPESRTPAFKATVITVQI